MIWDIWIAEQKLRSSSDEDVLRDTVAYLGHSHDRKRAVDLLVTAHGWLNNRFRDDHETVRQALIQQGQADSRPVINALREFPDTLFTYGDQETRKLLLSVLVRLDAPDAFDAIVECTQDLNRAVLRRDAAQALGQKGDTRAVPILLPRLNDPDREVRQEAARALGVLGDTSAIGPLQKSLTDWNADARKCAAEALRMLEWEPTSFIERADFAVADRDMEALTALGSDAAPFLILLLDHGYDEDQQFALEVLRSIGDARVLHDVMRAALDNYITAQESLDVLLLIIERDGKDARTEVLEELTLLPVVRGGERDYDGRVQLEPLDAQPVRSAARAELVRREGR